MKTEIVRSCISLLSEEINATQRAVAALHETSTIIMDKLDRILQESERRKRYIEVGYR